MNDLNQLTLSGRLTRDPNLKTFQSGSMVVELSLAVNRKFGAEAREETAFIDVEAWGKLAEIIKDRASKGSFVVVTGRLKQDSWETEEGKRSKLLVVAEDFIHVRDAGDVAYRPNLETEAVS